MSIEKSLERIADSLEIIADSKASVKEAPKTKKEVKPVEVKTSELPKEEVVKAPTPPTPPAEEPKVERVEKPPVPAPPVQSDTTSRGVNKNISLVEANTVLQEVCKLLGNSPEAIKQIQEAMGCDKLSDLPPSEYAEAVDNVLGLKDNLPDEEA